MPETEDLELEGLEAQSSAEGEPDADEGGDEQTTDTGLEAGEVGSGESCPGSSEADGGLSQSRALIEYVQDTYGHDVSHYKNDAELIRGLLHARSMVGVRNAEAQMFETLRRKLGDEKISALVRGEDVDLTTKKEEPEKKEEESIDFDPSWYYQVEVDPQTGKIRPAKDADPEVAEKMTKFLRKREELINELARSPKDFIRKHFADELERIRKEAANEAQAALESQLSAQNVVASAARWAEANKGVLFLDGDPDKGLTPLGEKFIDEFLGLEDAGMTDPVKRFDVALKLAKASMPERKPTRTAPPAAKKAPSTQAAKKPVTAEDLINQGVPLAEALMMAAEAGE